MIVESVCGIPVTMLCMMAMRNLAMAASSHNPPRDQVSQSPTRSWKVSTSYFSQSWALQRTTVAYSKHKPESSVYLTPRQGWGKHPPVRSTERLPSSPACEFIKHLLIECLVLVLCPHAQIYVASCNKELRRESRVHTLPSDDTTRVGYMYIAYPSAEESRVKVTC